MRPAACWYTNLQVEQILPFLVDEISRMRLGDPRDPATTHGPLVHAQQFASVQRHIQIGLDEGGRLVTGGPGRPEGLDRGFFCQPTVIADVTPDMTLAKEEIFGPVLVVMSYTTEDQALRIANDSIFGLGGYVFSEDRKRGYEFCLRHPRRADLVQRGEYEFLHADGRIQAVGNRPVDGDLRP